MVLNDTQIAWFDYIKYLGIFVVSGIFKCIEQILCCMPDVPAFRLRCSASTFAKKYFAGVNCKSIIFE